MRGKLLVVSGPSGSGKSTINKIILDSDPNCRFSVSATTRKPRSGETDGVHYYFLSADEFMRQKEKGEFYEYAEVFGNWYATPKKPVEEFMDRGYDVILDIDFQGAMQIKKAASEAILIFIMPPSIEELVRRLKLRNTESKEQLNTRIEKATAEMQKSYLYDYIILNDTIEKAVSRFREVLTEIRGS